MMLSSSRFLRNGGKAVQTLLKGSASLFSSVANAGLLQEYDSISKRGEDREPVTFKVGDSYEGFDCVKIRPVPELNLTAYQFIHKNTKADYIHLDTADRDNVFSATFRTPCTDSTGKSHILEHTTLCGSEKYPVHDPFMKMRKRSLQTFMNAMTFDDHTSFPVSSTIPRDLLNLMDVYCDSVFFPLLRLSDFRQEGWRLENEKIQGVVYNEMKGYASDVVRVLYDSITNSFLKDTNYQYVSGGSPLCIPSLQYEDLLAFHHSHYHPSNCLFYTYGDIHPSHHMHYLNSQVLNRFSFNAQSNQIQVSVVPESALTAEETRLEFTCPSESSSDRLKTHYLKLFPTNLTTDSEDSIKLQLLSLLLFKGQSAPFYKSMIENHYAKAFSPIQGYMTFSKNSFFVIGGCEIDKARSEQDFDNLIKQTLERVLEEGFDERRIQGILNEVQFSYKQIKSQYGLILMQSVMEAWTHHADPSFCLLSEGQLEAIRNEGVNKVMKEMIRKYLLPQTSQNGVKHIIVKEDNQYFEKMKQKELANQQKLVEKYKNGLPEYDESINPHLFAKEMSDDILPCLDVENIPKTQSHPSPVLYPASATSPRINALETTTNNIVYPRLFFTVNHHSYRDYLNLPILVYLMNLVDGDSISAEELEIQESQFSGGVRVGVSCYNQYKSDGFTFRNMAYIKSSLLMQDDNLSKVTSIFEHRLKNHSLRKSLPRIQTFLQSLIAEAQLDVTNRLSTLNHRRCRARDSIVSFIDDCYSGYQHYLHVLSLQPIVNDIGLLEKYITEELQPLLQKTFNRENMEVFVTSDGKNMKQMVEWGEKASSLVDSFDCSNVPVFGSTDQDGFIHISKSQFDDLRSQVPGSLGEFFKGGKNLFTRSGIITNHIISSHPSIASTSTNFDGVHILNKILSSTYLLHQIREEGGAYGVGSTHDDHTLLFTSYDDPHVVRTIDQFMESCKWIRAKNYSTKDIQEARLSLFSDIDSPTVPQQLGYEVFTGKTKEKRQKQRDVLLNISEKDLHEIAEKVFDCSSDKLTSCVFGNADSVKEIENRDNWIIDELPL